MPVLIVSEKTLAPRRLLEKARDAPRLVGDHDAELERIGDALQARSSPSRRCGRGAADQRGEIDVGQRVAGNDNETVRPRAAARANFTAPAVPSGVSSTTYAIEHADLRTVAEIVLDFVGEIVQGRDDVGDAVAAQQIDDVLHHRLVGDRRQRLGAARRQRPKARALAAGHHDGFHRPTLCTVCERASSMMRPVRASRPSEANASSGNERLRCQFGCSSTVPGTLTASRSHKTSSMATTVRTDGVPAKKRVAAIDNLRHHRSVAGNACCIQRRHPRSADLAGTSRMHLPVGTGRVRGLRSRRGRPSTNRPASADRGFRRSPPPTAGSVRARETLQRSNRARSRARATTKHSRPAFARENPPEPSPSPRRRPHTADERSPAPRRRASPRADSARTRPPAHSPRAESRRRVATPSRDRCAARSRDACSPASNAASGA